MSEPDVTHSTLMEPQQAATPVSNDVSYWKSPDFRELLVSLVFFALCSCIYLVDSVRMRPIPFQYLENSNEYVINLDNNQEVEGVTVSTAALLVCAEVVPFLLQLLLGKFGGVRGDVHGTACVYLIALGLTHLATEAIKRYVGYLRPSFYSVCEPSDNYEECTSDDSNDARKSFVSGHASVAFCGMMLLTLYCHERFGLPRAKKVVLQDGTALTSISPYRGRVVSIVSLAPLAAATFIAASRVVDNKHFPADVVGGSLLGGSIAIFIHGLWL